MHVPPSRNAARESKTLRIFFVRWDSPVARSLAMEMTKGWWNPLDGKDDPQLKAVALCALMAGKGSNTNKSRYDKMASLLKLHFGLLIDSDKKNATDALKPHCIKPLVSAASRIGHCAASPPHASLPPSLLSRLLAPHSADECAFVGWCDKG